MIALAFALVATMMAAPQQEAQREQLHPLPCRRYEWRESVEQREQMIRCVFARFGDRIPAHPDPVEVARCESGDDLNPRAVYGPHRGLFQHIYPTLWKRRAARYLARYYPHPERVSPFNALANALVTAEMVADRDQGWTAWSCA